MSAAYYSVAPLPDTNSRQGAITIRPPSSSLLAIDSEDRFPNFTVGDAAIGGLPTDLNVSPYDFTITKSESLMNGFFTRVGVTEVNFPWGIPNVNRKTQTVNIDYDGSAASGIATIEIAAGFLRPVALAAAIQDAVRTAAAPNLAAFTMTYGTDNTPRFFYSTNTIETVAFYPMTYNTSAYRFPATTKQLFNVLGMTTTNQTKAISGISAYTFCQFTRYVDIVCTQLTNNQALKDQMSQPIARDSLCRVYLGNANIPGNVGTGNDGSDVGLSPVYCPPGCCPFTIYRNFTHPKQIQWLPNQPIPGFLRFTVYDDAGAPLSEAIAGIDAPAGGIPSTSTFNQGTFLDWSMSMLVSEN
jgi:hypothetical protein